MSLYPALSSPALLPSFLSERLIFWKNIIWKNIFNLQWSNCTRMCKPPTSGWRRRQSSSRQMWRTPHTTKLASELQLHCFILNTWGKSKAEKISMMAIVMRLPNAVVIKYKACSTDFIEGGAVGRDTSYIVERNSWTIEQSPWLYANSKLVMENNISPMVTMVYWGSSHMMWIWLSSTTIIGSNRYNRSTNR